MEMIVTEKLNHQYNREAGRQVLALKGVDITITKGEFVVILGHNGSGKSTLAKHLNCLLLPSSGAVYVKGMNTSEEKHVWDIRQTVGMVFQNPDNQLVATVVEEDVAFGPENLGIKPDEIRNRVDNSLKSVGMYQFRQHAPHLLSGGQKQRVAIAGVLAMEPECIVLDEPTAMLDPVGRKEVISTIKKLNREKGITVVHITHFMDEAVEADRIIVMEAGHVVMDGSPADVFSRVEELKAIGLDVPQVTELAYSLRKEGLDIEGNILTIEEMVMKLCQ
jgi:energy-coupling factor transport system ATP-binding protein